MTARDEPLEKPNLDGPSCVINSFILSQDRSTCWTDDLPNCQYSGIGTSTNQIYKENGFRRESHEFEDRSFHFRLDNDVCLYGVFDGIGGSKVSAFASQNMPAEILLGQLANKKTDEDLKELLSQACMAVEKSYFDMLDNLVAERVGLIQQLSEGLAADSIQQNTAIVYKRLKEIDAELNGATSVLVSLIINDRLYVANIGSCRALLCKRSPDGYLRVIQLTSDHTLENASEIGRLAALGVDVNKVQQTRKLAGRFYTRSVGDFLIKQDYSKIDLLSLATSSPVIAVPEVYGGFEIDSSCCFLAMMSDGLYRTLQDAIGSVNQVNAEIAAIIAAQFESQSTLRDVAQATVDQIVRQHYRVFEQLPATATGTSRIRTHDDITLIVRGFNYPLAGRSAVDSRTPTGPVARTPAPLSISPLSISIPTPGPSSSADSPPRPFFGGIVPMAGAGGISANLADTTGDDEDNSPSFDEDRTRSVEEAARAVKALDLDESGRVASYVDFSEFDAAISSMSDADCEALFAELVPRPDFEPILEEREPLGVS